MEVKKSKLSCSFCGKQQSKVKKLIAGPNIYICNECVDLCNDILVEEEKSEADQSFQIAKPKEIYTLLDEIVVGQDEGGNVSPVLVGEEVIGTLVGTVVGTVVGTLEGCPEGCPEG